MDTLNYIINSLNVFFGITFNIISIIVIRVSTNDKQIEGYYTTLMIILFSSGIVSSIVTAILRLHILHLSGSLIFVPELLSHKYFHFVRNRIIIVIGIFTTYFTLTLPTSIIISRYLIICRNIKLSIWRVICLVLVSAILALLIASGVYSIIEEVPDELISGWVIRDKIKSDYINIYTKGVGSSIQTGNWKILITELPIYFFSNYAIVIVLFYKYHKHMKTFSAIMSDKTKIMNKEFMIILMCQSFAPIFVTGLPDLIYLLLLVINVSTGTETFGTRIYQLLNFTPTVNALFFLLLPSKNRKNIKTFLVNISTIFRNRKVHIDKNYIGKQSRTCKINLN
uniref:G_PROTEIN_RECEP_F1_2 domain-containing protein n=1 Tax=Parastrongyloides trichosuri TaxID=131310 RepID=A0A0N4ZZE9_PARTI